MGARAGRPRRQQDGRTEGLHGTTRAAGAAGGPPLLWETVVPLQAPRQGWSCGVPAGGSQTGGKGWARAQWHFQDRHQQRGARTRPGAAPSKHRLYSQHCSLAPLRGFPPSPPWQSCRETPCSPSTGYQFRVLTGLLCHEALGYFFPHFGGDEGFPVPRVVQAPPRCKSSAPISGVSPKASQSPEAALRGKSSSSSGVTEDGGIRPPSWGEQHSIASRH